MAMNILKKSRVLNQNCLREKIRELSPLLRNLDWPPSKDSVFRATWSYYACGCQERLSSIRRRIEQNARMVAPNKRTSTPLPVDLKLPFNEGQLPAGLDEDEHIYRELVSCFRNAESTGSMKRTPPKRSKIQRSFDVSKFSTPEQWINWKREEQQVGQLMEKSFDPYLKEEMSKKLQHLKKLTNRRPLVEVPIEKEIKEKPKLSLSKKRKSRLKYIDKSMSGTNESTNTPTKPIDKYKTPLNSGKTFLKSADQYNPASSSSTTYTNLEEKYNDLLNSTKTPANLVDKYKLPPSLRKTPTKLAEKYKLSPNLSKTYTKLADKYEFPSSSRKNHTILSENYKVPSSSRKTPPKFAEKYKVPSKSSKTSTKLAENNNLTPNLSKTYTKLADKYEFPPSSRKNHKILSENYKLSSSSRKIPAKFAEYKYRQFKIKAIYYYS
ncbi:uncharacterized protein LOC108042380 [Drosophila rhopaloa]|uniref:Uncharacterized protein LOC108042380 n=1 Tax=Drosophila rhopaloa TaxID=1041015 RepID=A0A6P4ESD6_DRORH|nr:uncharacterized protein LOC108042380 [Drosophila rhopaloa]